MLECLLRLTVPFAVPRKSHSRRVARRGLLVLGHVRSQSSLRSFRTLMDGGGNFIPFMNYTDHPGPSQGSPIDNCGRSGGGSGVGSGVLFTNYQTRPSQARCLETLVASVIH